MAPNLPSADLACCLLRCSTCIRSMRRPRNPHKGSLGTGHSTIGTAANFQKCLNPMLAKMPSVYNEFQVLFVNAFPDQAKKLQYVAKKNHLCMTLDEEVQYEEAGSTDIPIITDLDAFLRPDFENAEDN
ncbi:hypothetical protein BV898_01408 [Hypsibius exemplaris]|uniref:Uncharacterized protein n=1 Tax=Hypsibius exemplaris TaxID=2072580 RepID=A0A1W0XBP4_HYPEX|nr:hypothetical protein BV898_01408 [Hypsibius exemplaris]